MSYTYEQLSRMNVTQLREIAKDIEHEAVHGFSTMHKEKLLPAICTALNIEAHAHHHVVGLDKGKVKSEIRELKRRRDELLGKHDPKALKEVRATMKELKKKLRRATV
jgi:hypothetical protein